MAKDDHSIKGDPFGETRVLVGLQQALGKNQKVLDAAQATARGMSHFGEHALGWMATAAVGAVADPARRREWVGVGVSAFSAHAASVVIKRIVRRPRPHDPAIHIGVGTPSKLSFPSSHATSSSAALASISSLTKSRLPLVGIPAMGLSRLILGVHYPSDVVAGSVIGLATSAVVDKVMARSARGKNGVQRGE